MPNRYPDRRLRRRRPTRRYILNRINTRAARYIQKGVRGMLARKTVKRLKATQTIQRIVRGGLARRRLARARNSNLRTAYPAPARVDNPYPRYRYARPTPTVAMPARAPMVRMLPNPYPRYKYNSIKKYPIGKLPNPYKKR